MPENYGKKFDKVEMKGAKDDMVNFYTALYHSLLIHIYIKDVDGENIKGLDQYIHDAKNFKKLYHILPLGHLPHFTHFQHQPQRNNDMIQSMMAHYSRCHAPVAGMESLC
nr:glycoside hydrolase domain-containing protein [Candidatus Brachybacter algidus]